MAKPIPYDDDPPETDDRDMRKIVLYDEEALKLMQGWTGGQNDPLYAISSTGGWNYAWVFTDAIVNIDRDLRSVKKLGRNKFQLGKGTFSKKEIDELAYIRDALQMALDDPDSELVDEVREHRVADFNTLEHLVEHAASELGATHVSGAGPTTKIYFPRGGEYPYEAASVRRKGGYWHADGPGAREGVKKLPAGARPIGGHVGRRAAEGRAVDPTAWYIDLYEGERVMRTFGPYASKKEASRVTRSRARAGLQWGDPYQGMDMGHALGAPRSGGTVRDYIAVDRRGQTIAGPFKSYGDAKSAAGTAGVVKFVGRGASEARRGSGSSLEQAESFGFDYAINQIGSDHFRDWAHDQLIEASKMDPSEVLPLETKDDALKVARNMLQQLEWDTKRDLGNPEIRRITGAFDYPEAWFKGFHRACETAKDGLADELLEWSSEIKGRRAGKARRRPKAKRSVRRRR